MVVEANTSFFLNFSDLVAYAYYNPFPSSSCTSGGRSLMLLFARSILFLDTLNILI